MAESHGEAMLALQLRAVRAPAFEREFRFHPERKWRFDLAWPARHIAAEIEGGTRSNGRHNRHDGFEADAEKYNAAAELGWRVFRFTTGMVRRGDAVATMERVLGGSA